MSDTTQETLCVRFDASVLQSIRRHARTSMEAEICGVLLGHAGDSCTHIDACIAGEKSAKGAAHVTFTQNTWEHIYSIKDRDFPETKIVGWYHSHPGFGVFLSHHDTFIHENFFSAPHQVAWVFDPHSDEEGCFGWSEGKIRRLQRFEVSTEVPDTPPQPEPEVVVSKGPSTPTLEVQAPSPKRKLVAAWERIPMRKRLLLLLVGLVVLLAVIAVQLSLLFGKPEFFKLPSARLFFERILHTARSPSSPPVGKPSVDGGQTEISSGGTTTPILATNTVCDSAPEEEPQEAPETNTNIEARPESDSPGLVTDLPPDSASLEPN